MDCEYSVTIAVPPGRVWDTLIDVERMPEWTPSVRDVRRLDDGPFAIGSQARVRQPRVRPLVWTVTVLDPPRSFVWTATTGGLRLTAGHDVTGGRADADRGDQDHAGDPDGADGVTVRLSFQVAGRFAPLLALLVGPQIRRYLQLEAEGLKRRCEGR